MKKTYKIIPVFIIVSIFLSIGLFSTATDAPSLSVETQNGQLGDTVLVTVKTSAVSLGAITVNLDYDESVLEFQTGSAAVGAAGSAFNYTSANKVVDKSQLRFSGTVSGLNNVVVDGALMTAKFKILKDNSPISINISVGSAYTADYNHVSITPAIGTINVYNVDNNLNFSVDANVATAAELTAYYHNDSNAVRIINSSGTVISGLQKVGTGCKIVIDGISEIPVIVMADLNGDGERDNYDYILCRNSSVELVLLSSIEFEAADLNGDGAVDAFDTALMDLQVH